MPEFGPQSPFFHDETKLRFLLKCDHLSQDEVLPTRADQHIIIQVYTQ